MNVILHLLEDYKVECLVFPLIKDNKCLKSRILKVGYNPYLIIYEIFE